MAYRKVNMFNFALILFEISILSAQKVPNTSSNQGAPLSSVQPGLFDPGATGFPNFGPGRFGNPTSNYPANPFFPNGNQNNNMGRPQNQGNYPNGQYQGGYPNQKGFPYQGGNMNPNTNYPGPQYPNRPNDGSMYPNQNPNQGNFQNRPISGNPNGVGFPNSQGFPFQGNNMNNNFLRPQYPNGPNNPSLNTANFNRPFQNGGMLNQGGNFNQGNPGQGDSGTPFQNPSQGGHYPNQGNFNPDFRPDDLSNINNPNVQFPGNEKPYQNQYNPLTGLPYQNSPSFGQPNYPQTYPSNNINGNNVQFPMTYPNGNRPAQFANPDSIVFPGHTNNADNYTNMPQNRPQTLNNQGTNFLNYPNNNTVSILGKPVIVAPAQGQGVFNSSTENPTRRKCIQDCPSTTEYNPICGTNNVTYINPGKFICARNCGEVVYLQKQGRCDGVSPKPSH